MRIPAAGIDASVGLLGRNADGTVEVPSDPDDAGWYRYGPSPGRPGSAVILGHVDSDAGPAVFADLSVAEPGDRIVVRLADGTTARFRVRWVRVYANADFPDRQVYASHGPPSLDVITCGGTYDAALGGYQANVVVHAT